MSLGKYLSIWFFLICTIIFEFILFKDYLLQSVIGFYPATYDQAVYLPLVYGIYENINTNGITSFLHFYSYLPTGILFPFNAILLFLLFEPDRFYALLPNFIYFAIFQLTLFWTVKKVTRNYLYAFIAFLLLLTLKTPFIGAGGIADYRMDFIAFCTYGIFISFVMRSEVFLHRNWSLITGLIATLMISMRFMMLVYVFIIFFFVISYFIKEYFFSASQQKKDAAKTRVINIFFSGLLISFFILPLLFVNYTSLYEYYIRGHFTGEEHFLRGFHATNLYNYLMLYPNVLKSYHLGTFANYSILLLLISFPLLYNFFPQRPIMNNPSRRWEFVFLTISIIVPLMVLTIDPSKSHIVSNIVVGPLIWLVILICSQFQLTLPPKLTISFLSVFFIIALIFQWNSYNKDKLTTARVAELHVLNKMYMDIGNYSVKAGLDNIVFSHDQPSEFINHGCLKTVYYEQRKKMLNVAGSLLGASLLPITKDQAFDTLKKSNIIVLTIDNYSPSHFPFSESILRFHSALVNYAEKNFTKMGDYIFLENHYRVYTNRSLG